MSATGPKWKRIASNLGIDVAIGRINNGLNRQKAMMAQLDRMEAMLHELVLRGNGPDKGTQIQLAQLYKKLSSADVRLEFEDVEFRNYSQFGEDGILHYVFSIIGTTNRTCVEMCAGNGIECNTANLIINHGWNGLLIEGNEERVAEGRKFYDSHPDTMYRTPVWLQGWITRDNVNDLISNAGFSGDIDLFSLDMDGVDYWIWEALECIRPRVVILEANVHMGTEPVTVPYRDDFETGWIPLDAAEQASPEAERGQISHWTMYGGASLSAFAKLAGAKGYRLIGTNRDGFNAVFLRNDVGADTFTGISPADCVKHSTRYQVQRGSSVLLQQELVRV